MSTWILDPGHEGLSPGGLYLRRGKQSPQVPPGIYEGVFNREICERVKHLCLLDDIPCVITNPGPINATLKQRYSYCNKLHAIRKDCIVICIHANAAGRGQWQTRREGTVVFHSSNASKMSKRLCTHLSFNMQAYTELAKGGIKQANFSMVYKTKCPAAYLEIGFMDSKKDAEYMASETGQREIANTIFYTIMYLNK